MQRQQNFATMVKAISKGKSSKSKVVSFRTYISRVLKQAASAALRPRGRRGASRFLCCAALAAGIRALEVHPKMTLSKTSMTILNNLCTDSFDKVALAAARRSRVSCARNARVLSWSFGSAGPDGVTVARRGLRTVLLRSEDALVEVATEAGKLCKMNNKKTLTSREVRDRGVGRGLRRAGRSSLVDEAAAWSPPRPSGSSRLPHPTPLLRCEIQTAIRLVFPGELAKHAVSEGTKAVTKSRETHQRSVEERPRCQILNVIVGAH